MCALVPVRTCLPQICCCSQGLSVSERPLKFSPTSSFSLEDEQAQGFLYLPAAPFPYVPPAPSRLTPPTSSAALVPALGL